MLHYLSLCRLAAELPNYLGSDYHHTLLETATKNIFITEAGYFFPDYESHYFVYRNVEVIVYEMHNRNFYYKFL
jgi:hypothetical protein